MHKGELGINIKSFVENFKLSWSWLLRRQIVQALVLGNLREDMERFVYVFTDFRGESQTFMDMACVLEGLSFLTSNDFLQVEVLVV